MTVIYMPLLNEGTDVSRPVEAKLVGHDTYLVEGDVPEDEEWAFGPGSVVRCELWTMGSGEKSLKAVERAD